MTKFFLSAILIGGIWAAATGEVYLEGPRRSARPRGKAVPERAFRELVDAKDLMTEPVVCNGVRTELKTSLIRRPLAELLDELRSRYPDIKFTVRRGGVLFSIRLGDRRRERVLLVGTGDRVTCFAMLLPDPMPKLPAWPRELPPLPDGAAPDEIIEFPGNGGVYGSFSGAGPGALSRTAAALAADGYAPVTREAHSPIGRGELFLNAARQRMVTLSIGPDGTGTMYLAPLSSPK